MNKIKYYLCCLLCLVIYSCSNEDFAEDIHIPVDYDAADISPVHFYGIAYPGVQNSTRGVAQRDNLWYPGTTIKVKFLNDPYNMADVVKTYAAEWEKYANISFSFVESGNAHVRIGFDWNDERYITWSYVGTDCKMVTNQNEATMSFAYWDSSTEQEIKGDVLRAFGQVLGLELEHRHLSFDPGWTNRIADYWEGEIEDVTWDNLQKYVFTPLEQNDVIQTAEYDEESIMIWPFSSRYAKNTLRSFNYELSQQDKEFIGAIYPKAEGEAIVTMVVKTTHQYQYTENFEIWIRNNSEIIIDWGDAVQDTVSASPDEFVFISYQVNNESRIVKLYGETNALTHLAFGKPTFNVFLEKLDVSRSLQLVDLSCWGYGLSALDVSKNLQLISLNCSGSNIAELDLSKNTNLKELNCGRNPLIGLDVSALSQLRKLECSTGNLTELDLTNNSYLESLSCNGNSLATLDVSNNPLLEYLDCSNNSFTTLDVSNNKLLRTLYCTNNQFSSLDFSNNIDLTYLNCTNNMLTSLDVSNSIHLGNLYCSNNQLPSLDLSNNTQLTNLECFSNQLQALDISNNRKLRCVCCHRNSIQELNVSMNNDLIDLYCEDNQLTALDFSNTPKISKVICYNNPLNYDSTALSNLLQSLPVRPVPDNPYPIIVSENLLEINTASTLPGIRSQGYNKGWIVWFYDL